ncbi:MAG: PAS domain-containing protein [Acidobacteriota bacterium]|nr:MAG: PAS domain-containing protein [Acidobacteriota bacterium]
MKAVTDAILEVAWRSRLTVRLTAGVVLVLLVIGIPFLLAFHRLERQRQVEVLETAAGSLSRIVVDGLRSSMVAERPHLLDEAVRNLASRPDVERVVILDKEGLVRVTSDESLTEDRLDRERDAVCGSCHEADAAPPSAGTAVVKEGDRRVLRAMSAIRNEVRCHRCHDSTVSTNGVLLIDVPLQAVDQRFFADIGRTATLGGIMVLLTIAALGWLLNRMVHRPLRDVVATSRKIARGELEARVPIRSESEFALLARQVNKMTDHLASSIAIVERQRIELAAILDAISDEVVVLNRDRRVVAANAAFIKNTGSCESAVLGKECSDASGENWTCTTDERQGCPVEKVLRSGSVEEAIVPQTDADGTERVIEVHASPIFGPEGEVQQVVEVRRDISTRRQLEASLVHSERLASIGLLASGVSHEINNPLGVISTSVQGLKRLIEQRTDLPRDVRDSLEQWLDRVDRETQRGRSITDRLLRAARPAGSGRSLIDVNQAIEETLTLLGHALRKTDIKTSLDLAESLPPIVSDETQVKQLLLNLVINSIQAMELDGGLLRISTSSEKGSIRIVIEDTGEGIEPRSLKRIYDPFFTTKPPGKGTGLGLYICHRIVEELGGSIHAASRPGDKTTFTVKLELSNSKVSCNDEQASNPSAFG